MRLQRALAQAGVASRRASEELIRAGKVRVNGEVAALGTVVEPGKDAITVVGRVMRPITDATVVLHKPIGWVVSRADPQGRSTIFDLVPEIPGLSYVGRLDIMTSGLLLLTTNGELNNRLTHPRYHVPRTYRVTVRGSTCDRIREALTGTVQIGGRRVDLRDVVVRPVRNSGMAEIRLTLFEGRNRIVRRTCEELGLVVQQLVRLSHGPVQLGGLETGEWRHVTAPERARLRRLTSPRG
jgi:23S rRNA pseudouridine2605 synthase